MAMGRADGSARLRRRHAAEKRFKLYGIAAIAVALLVLIVLLGSIVANGATAFMQSHVELEINFDEEEIDPAGSREQAALSGANYTVLVRRALQSEFPEVEGRSNNAACRHW